MGRGGWHFLFEDPRDEPPRNPKIEKLYQEAEEILSKETTPEKLKDNPFKGKPLNLGGNPYEKRFGMAHRMLKSAGFKLPWMDMKDEIIQEKTALERALRDHVAWLNERREEYYARGVTSADKRRIEAEHTRFLTHVKNRIAALRRKIDRFNLEVPLVDQQLVNVQFESFTARWRAEGADVLASINQIPE